MAWLKILPGYETFFRERGWTTVAPFFEWTGVLVNRHRRRQVEQVCLPGSLAGGKESTALPGSFFLKKEHALNWRERFRNLFQGFGWCATVVREATTLQAAKVAGIGCPDVVAFGADGPRAFLLLRDESTLIDLPRFLLTLGSDTERNHLAEIVGRELARLHAAGFQHPDLFAKHLLVGRDSEDFRICILDWARARQLRSVSQRMRWRDLAALDATLHQSLANAGVRMRCLRAYFDARVNVSRIARTIRREALRLRQQRNIREAGQLPTPAADQSFVPCCEGRLLVVRSYHDLHGGRLPDWLNALAMGLVPVEDFTVANTIGPGAETTDLQSWPSTSGKLDMPPIAHTLFRLHRYGVSGPRLLAVGASAGRIFVVTQSRTAIPFERAFAHAPTVQRSRLLEQAGRIVRRIHEAGYFLRASDSWARTLAVAEPTEDVLIGVVDALIRGEAMWQELALREFNRESLRLTRSERWRFLHGYLGRPERPSGINALAPELDSSNERQFTA